ncbi:hypothetical protein FWH09_00800 [Candidatus Saccharibacteria bacterium]|nr:hypothetical protein [Candidatus Saccharibacteria bacterium]
MLYNIVPRKAHSIADGNAMRKFIRTSMMPEASFRRVECSPAVSTDGAPDHPEDERNGLDENEFVGSKNAPEGVGFSG